METYIILIVTVLIFLYLTTFSNEYFGNVIMDGPHNIPSNVVEKRWGDYTYHEPKYDSLRNNPNYPLSTWNPLWDQENTQYPIPKIYRTTDDLPIPKNHFNYQNKASYNKNNTPKHLLEDISSELDLDIDEDDENILYEIQEKIVKIFDDKKKDKGTSIFKIIGNIFNFFDNILTSLKIPEKYKNIITTSIITVITFALILFVVLVIKTIIYIIQH